MFGDVFDVEGQRLHLVEDCEFALQLIQRRLFVVKIIFDLLAKRRLSVILSLIL